MKKKIAFTIGILALLLVGVFIGWLIFDESPTANVAKSDSEQEKIDKEAPPKNGEPQKPALSETSDEVPAGADEESADSSPRENLNRVFPHLSPKTGKGDTPEQSESVVREVSMSECPDCSLLEERILAMETRLIARLQIVESENVQLRSSLQRQLGQYNVLRGEVLALNRQIVDVEGADISLDANADTVALQTEIAELKRSMHVLKATMDSLPETTDVLLLQKQIKHLQARIEACENEQGDTLKILKEVKKMVIKRGLPPKQPVQAVQPQWWIYPSVVR